MSRESEDKSDGELSEGELLSDEGEVSDEGELPQSEPEDTPSKSPELETSPQTADKFDRYKIWQEAMVNNMRSAISKVGDAGQSSSESSDSEEDNPAFMMNDSEIPPNLRGYEDKDGNLLGALGVAPDENGGEGQGEVKRKKKKKKKSTPSEWWERHKEIYEKMKERRLEMDAHRARTHCKFFQKGFCKEGDDCPFLHEIRKKLDVCKYFMKNLPCHKGDRCQYMHNEFPCKYFHLRGFCYNDKGCRFSHEALTDDTRQIIEWLKNDRFDRPRFKRFRSRSRSRSRSPVQGDVEKPLFTESDSTSNKKVLLPTPEEKAANESQDMDHDKDMERDSDRSSRRYDDRQRGNRFFRGGRGRGSPRGGGRFSRGRGFHNRGGGFGNNNNNRRGGFEDRNNRSSNQFNDNSNNFQQSPSMNRGGHEQFDQGQNNFNPGGDNFNTSPNIPTITQPNFSQVPANFNTGFIQPDQQGAAVPVLQSSGSPQFSTDFAPMVPNQFQRPPPPPPPLQSSSPAQLATAAQLATSDFGGNKSAAELQAESKVCAARDPRLKQNSEKEKGIAEPSLADMFKSLDPTASPFG